MCACRHARRCSLQMVLLWVGTLAVENVGRSSARGAVDAPVLVPVRQLGLNWDRRWIVVNGSMALALMQTPRNAPALVADVLVGGSSALAPVAGRRRDHAGRAAPGAVGRYLAACRRRCWGPTCKH